MATHSSVLAWRIAWTEKPGRLQSRGSQKVRHNWATNIFTSMDILHFVYPFINWWTFRLFPLWEMWIFFMNNAAMNVHVPVFVWSHVFIFLGYTSRSKMAGLCGNSILTGTAILFSKTTPLCIPTSTVGGSQTLHLHQHLLSFVFSLQSS